jgi:pantoate--beta-alanine ligase
MQIFHDLPSWQAHRATLDPAFKIGFVPTMGNLHQGHVSLFQKSKKDNDISIVSIFVNPTQFNQKEDFNTYPRTLEQDLAILEGLGMNYCLLPTEEAMYTDSYRYRIEEQGLSQLMEGQHRPGHFTGVLTVVMKLLQLVKPAKIYFGEKDYQQYLLIKDMAAAFFLDTQVIACPTIREASGLAFSSRNNRLNAEQRQTADVFASIFHQHEKSCASIQAELEKENILVEYIMDYEGRRFAAVVIGGVRLIDNYWVVG